MSNFLKHPVLHNYDLLGCKMSLMVHFFGIVFKFFHQNLRDVSDEHGERFHQDVAIIEKRIKRKIFCENACTLLLVYKKGYF